MSQKTRLLGRDVQIRLASGGVPLTTMTAIKDFTFTTNQRILSEGFLGEDGNRQDSIYDDISGSFSIEPEDPEIFLLQRAIYDKARARRQGDVQITLSCRASLPNGKVVKFTFPEMEFDPISVNVGGRDAYVAVSFSFKSEKYILTV